ncbi:MAG TPA: TMEM175 family protein [Candidatus Baltobacteraceae bacterium]|jgi:hypothetical protein
MSDGPSQSVLDPRDERVIHRLEAFSDIVIGFSLALLAINLVAPQSVAEIPGHATELATFFVCFFLIAFLWWFHNRVFAHLYVASVGSIVLNIAMLAGVVMLVYTAQIVSNVAKAVHPFDVHGYVLALSLWLGIYGVVLVLLGGMGAIGLRARWIELSDPVRRWGLKQSINGLVGGAVVVLIGVLMPRLPIAYAGFVSLLAFATLIVERYLVPRLIARAAT